MNRFIAIFVQKINEAVDKAGIEKRNEDIEENDGDYLDLHVAEATIWSQLAFQCLKVFKSCAKSDTCS